MSKKSNNNGRAYEYACITMLESALKEKRRVKVNRESGYEAAFNAYKTLTSEEQSIYLKSAYSAVVTLMDLEPMIMYGDEEIYLEIQTDKKGTEGDVRDILIIRLENEWEIGLSVKHNHDAVKHPRLSTNLDFGEKWYGIACSPKYWKNTNPIFEYLEEKKGTGLEWKDLPNKEGDVYRPILEAFLDEIKYAYDSNKDLPARMVEFLLGKFDYYKVISRDSKKLTQIQSFNLRGTLNKPNKEKKANIIVPIAKLPSRIIHADFKPGSNTTVEIILDEGWQLSFRIHNAEKMVEPTLKFDIKLIGVPAAIISIETKWAE